MSTRVGTGRVTGPVTSCHIDLPEGEFRVEGGDDVDASVAVRYLERHDAASDPVVDGVVAVGSRDGTLTIRSAGTTLSRLPGLLASVRRPRVALDLRLPRDARVEVETVGGDVLVTGCRGGQMVSSVTGGMRVLEARGPVEARSVSGPVEVEGDRLEVRAATTSGRIRVRAGWISASRVHSVSGRIDMAGSFAPGGEHQIDSLSGDVTVTASGGVTLACRTMAGRLRDGEGARRDLRDGRPALVVGHGDAMVNVTTVSGDIRLVAGAPARAPDPGSAMSPTPDPMLDALEALVRGDISLEEADRRLETIHG